MAWVSRGTAWSSALDWSGLGWSLLWKTPDFCISSDGGVWLLGPALLAYGHPRVYLNTKRAPEWTLQVIPAFAQEMNCSWTWPRVPKQVSKKLKCMQIRCRCGSRVHRCPQINHMTALRVRASVRLSLPSLIYTHIFGPGLELDWLLNIRDKFMESPCNKESESIF